MERIVPAGLQPPMLEGQSLLDELQTTLRGTSHYCASVSASEPDFLLTHINTAQMCSSSAKSPLPTHKISVEIVSYFRSGCLKWLTLLYRLSLLSCGQVAVPLRSSHPQSPPGLERVALGWIRLAPGAYVPIQCVGQAVGPRSHPHQHAEKNFPITRQIQIYMVIQVLIHECGIQNVNQGSLKSSASISSGYREIMTFSEILESGLRRGAKIKPRKFWWRF